MMASRVSFVPSGQAASKYTKILLPTFTQCE